VNQRNWCFQDNNLYLYSSELCLYVCFKPTYTLRGIGSHGGVGLYNLRFCIFHLYIALLQSFAVELLIHSSPIHCDRISIILKVQKRNLNHPWHLRTPYVYIDTDDFINLQFSSGFPLQLLA
jgi:hypothetical protein